MGAGVLGLSAARALAADGLSVVVYEQHSVGTLLGSSPGRSRIFRRAYPEPDLVWLAVRSIEEWLRLDRRLLRFNGLLIAGAEARSYADGLEQSGIDPCWLDPGDARARFPEAVFDGPVLWDSEAGAVLADDALRALRAGLDVREGVRVDDPRDLDTDLVVVCAGAWTGPLTGLPLVPRIEQVTYFGGAPDSRPSVIDLGDDGTTHYGLVAPGVGYKVAQDHARPGEWDPDRIDRPIDPAVEGRLVEHVRGRFPGLDPAPLHSEACLYTMSPDGDYILDVVDGVVVCGGDSGHAFKTGPAWAGWRPTLPRPSAPAGDRSVPCR